MGTYDSGVIAGDLLGDLAILISIGWVSHNKVIIHKRV